MHESPFFKVGFWQASMALGECVMRSGEKIDEEVGGGENRNER
jgi:hypothetical protein